MRDTLPSLFLSAAEKFGMDVEAPDCALVVPLAPEAAEPLVVWLLVLLEGMLLSGLLDCAPVLPDEVWANEALDSARSAAAVALARTFRFIWMLLLRNGWSELQRPTRKRCAGSPRRAGAGRSSAAGAARRTRSGARSHAGAFRAAAPPGLHGLALLFQAATPRVTLQPHACIDLVAMQALRRARELGAGADARARTLRRCRSAEQRAKR